MHLLFFFLLFISRRNILGIHCHLHQDCLWALLLLFLFFPDFLSCFSWTEEIIFGIESEIMSFWLLYPQLLLSDFYLHCLQKGKPRGNDIVMCVCLSLIHNIVRDHSSLLHSIAQHLTIMIMAMTWTCKSRKQSNKQSKESRHQRDWAQQETRFQFSLIEIVLFFAYIAVFTTSEYIYSWVKDSWRILKDS